MEDLEFVYNIINNGHCVRKRKLDKRQYYARYIWDNTIYLISFMDNTPIDIEVVEYL